MPAVFCAMLLLLTMAGPTRGAAYGIFMPALEVAQREAQAPADDDDDDGRRISPHGLDEALKHGEIRPLDQVLAAVRARFEGEIIEIEPERHGARWIYEVKLLGPDGRRRRI